ncbi:Na(+) H(+) antiporter subunit D [Fulvivirga imtechensis AK7]|uniref:Na(+) H(+) antiporter subunit D n=1 Tax=Fulvivirga imtechensis AK7 TaxID=1237149 RepID=L8JSV7_9BACT|nr:proton-conducting transporter membrane subunit [Fulvivirga imtechensis]ELR70447.1 Na(+) H(+) antiporter subunit D [Fulvivirga imtechensis AK7]
MITLPILIPFASIILLLLFKNIVFKRFISITATLLLLVSSIYLLNIVHVQGIQVMHVGNWPAPMGIPLVIDMFSAIMLVMSGIIGICISIFSTSNVGRQRELYHFHPLFNALLLGVNGAFITGDIFNLFVWFEVMLMASFCLLVLGNEKAQLEGAIKYITLSLLSSFFFIAGIGLIYGETGTLNMADLARIIKEDNSMLMNTSAMLFFIAFGIKAAMFPFFYWLPASYHTPPVAVSALFAGLLTKVGVYGLIRSFTLFFIHNTSFWHTLLLVTAGATMLIGVLMAASQNDIRRILSFHIISQIGYMIMGLGIFTPLGIAGAIYFIFHNVMAKTNTFLVAGILNHLKGSYHLKTLRGVYNERPLVALLFFIPAMALAGLPPLSGFFGKFLLVKAGLESQQYVISFFALLVSIITLFSMIKIWNKAFWQEDQNTPTAKTKLSIALALPCIVLASLSIALGIGASFFIDLTTIAAEQLLNPDHYIKAILGGATP